LSICFLDAGPCGVVNGNRAVMQSVVQWWMPFPTEQKRTVKMSTAAYDLFRQFTAMFVGRAKDSVSYGAPSRAPLPDKVKKYFVRVLFPPLFPPEKLFAKYFTSLSTNVRAPAQAESALAELQNRATNPIESIRALKERGAVYVRTRDFAQAADAYQACLLVYYKVMNGGQGPQGGELATLACQSHLNRALCLLKLNNPGEAIVSCSCALELLESNPDTALIAKAHYRMGLAFEQQADLAAAEAAFATALEASAGDKTIAEALARRRRGKD
jgi:tetratricopeptide (TPR) repeat protein